MESLRTDYWCWQLNTQSNLEHIETYRNRDKTRPIDYRTFSVSFNSLPHLGLTWVRYALFLLFEINCIFVFNSTTFKITELLFFTLFKRRCRQKKVQKRNDKKCLCNMSKFDPRGLSNIERIVVIFTLKSIFFLEKIQKSKASCTFQVPADFS